MTHDVVLRGGDVVDGTGAPRRRADVGMTGGRIVAVGTIDEPGATEIDVTGKVVAPGFVDVHTHYDVQLLWDPYATPSPLHGVTTVIGGNCGVSIAPLQPGDDYILRMMAHVEGMPLESVLAGPAWDWQGFGEYLDTMEGKLGVNAGFLVGHSTIRRLVMGEQAVGNEATPEQLAAMVAAVHDALAAGALGFSSAMGDVEFDADGNPAPSRAASPEEFFALAGACREHEGTILEFIPAMGEISEARMDLMTGMSLAAGRPLNWNLLGSFSATEVFEQQLSATDHARARGAEVVALTVPDVLRLRASTLLLTLPPWKAIAVLPEAERRTALADASRRAGISAAIEAAKEFLSALATPELLQLVGGPHKGRMVADVAAERGVDFVEVLLDDVLAPGELLDVVFPSLVPSMGVSDESWAARAAVWRDDRVLLGGSDAGAHLDLMCQANYTTALLGQSVRDRGVLGLEEGVRLLTDVPARLFGLRDRGRIAEGWHADLVVFDPATIDTEPAFARHDLPAGGLRLYAESTGIEYVFVAGQAIVDHGELTGAVPGTVLRSGRDTETVAIPAG
jgi:N-acyl-D-aspartate/D-glutamate deacylase